MQEPSPVEQVAEVKPEEVSVEDDVESEEEVEEIELSLAQNSGLLIDSHEDTIIQTFGHVVREEKLTIPESTIFRKQLAIGDFAIITRTAPGSKDIAIRQLYERKSMEDLVKSIVETRFDNQISRMLQHRKDYPDTILGLLIECQPSNSNSFYINKVNALTDLGIHVIYTHSAYGTVKFLLDRIRTIGESHSLPELVNLRIARYREFKGKKADISPEKFLVEVLKIIPQVTPQCAEVISKRHRSVWDFMEHVVPDSLLGITYPTEKGNSARIGKVRAQRIVDMFWNGDSHRRSSVQRLLSKQKEHKRNSEHLKESSSAKRKKHS